MSWTLNELTYTLNHYRHIMIYMISNIGLWSPSQYSTQLNMMLCRQLKHTTHAKNNPFTTIDAFLPRLHHSACMASALTKTAPICRFGSKPTPTHSSTSTVYSVWACSSGKPDSTPLNWVIARLRGGLLSGRGLADKRHFTRWSWPWPTVL